MKAMTIGELFTDAEVRKAAALYKKLHGTGQFAAAVCEQVVQPNMERINKTTGQENDAMYLAYALEHVLGIAR